MIATSRNLISESTAPKTFIRNGVFPAFGVGWVLSNQKFWKPLQSVISFFKVRYTNGMIGNQATPNRFLYMEALQYDSGYGYTFGTDRRKVDGYKVKNEAVKVTWE